MEIGRVESTKRAHDYYFVPAWPFCCLRCSARLADPNERFCDFHKAWLEDLCMRTVDPSVVPGTQLKVLKFVIEQVRNSGLSPSLEEIGGKLGYTRQAAHYHVKALGERGLIVRYRGQARSIRATTLGQNLIARYERDEKRRLFERSEAS